MGGSRKTASSTGRGPRTRRPRTASRSARLGLAAARRGLRARGGVHEAARTQGNSLSSATKQNCLKDPAPSGSVPLGLGFLRIPARSNGRGAQKEEGPFRTNATLGIQAEDPPEGRALEPRQTPGPTLPGKGLTVMSSHARTPSKGLPGPPRVLRPVAVHTHRPASTASRLRARTASSRRAGDLRPTAARVSSRVASSAKGSPPRRSASAPGAAVCTAPPSVATQRSDRPSRLRTKDL